MRHDRSTGGITVVTSAGLSHSQDISLRQRRYVISQSVRILCVVLAVVLPVPVAWKGLLLVGAIALPWFGVVMANAGPTRARAQATAMMARPSPAEPVRLAIEPGRVIDQDSGAQDQGAQD